MRRVPDASLRVCLLLVVPLVFLGSCATSGTTVREVLVVDRRDVGSLVGDAAVEAHLPRAATLGPLPRWASATDIVIGDFSGVAVEVSFDDPAELEERLARIHQLLAAAVQRDVAAAVQYVPTGDGWRFVLQAQDAQPPPGSGPAPGAEELYRSAVLRLTLDLPGWTVAHNATATNGNRLVWDMPLTSTRAELFAVTEPGPATSLGTPGSLTTWVTVAASLGSLAVAAAVVGHRRGGRGDAVPPGRRTVEGRSTARSAQDWPTAPPAVPPAPRGPPGPPDPI